MSVERFRECLARESVQRHDRTWFPRWVGRYLGSVSQAADVVTQVGVIAIMQSLRDRGMPAWQRLQAVRATGCYRNLVVQSDEPSRGAPGRMVGRQMRRPDQAERRSGSPSRDTKRSPELASLGPAYGLR